MIDITMLVTFHSEGILAHSTLNSIERCRKYVEQLGIRTEYVWVLDNVDDETRSVLLSHPAAAGRVELLEVRHQDTADSRNAGISVARGRAVAILDGDDYYSTNWIERAWHYLHEYGSRAIVHPEFVINFGFQSAYCWQVDQAGEYFDPNGLLMNNYWTSWSFAYRSVYLDHPYVPTRALETGFGFEDWHWNCETIAAGFHHRLAWGAVGFYRRKISSRVSHEGSAGAILQPTSLFNMPTINNGVASYVIG